MANGGNLPFISVTHQHGTPASGFVLVTNYGVTPSTMYSSCNSTTGDPAGTSWGGANMSVAPSATTSAGEFSPNHGSTASIKFVLNQGTTSSRAYLNITVSTTFAPHRYIDIDIRRDPDNFAEMRRYYFQVSSAAALASPHTNVEIPQFRTSTWHTWRVKLANSSEVMSIGIRSAGDGAGTDQDTFYVDNIRKSAMTELDTALEANTSKTILIPADYVTASTQGFVEYSTADSVMDLRPSGVRIIRQGAREPRNYFVDTTGGNAHVALSHFFTNIVQDFDYVQFPPYARINLGYHTPTLIATKTHVTIDGQNSMFYIPSTGYADGTGSGRTSAKFPVFILGNGDSIKQKANNNLVFKNMDVYGVPRAKIYTVTSNGASFNSTFAWVNTGTCNATSAAGGTTLDGTINLATTSNNIRTAYGYHGLFPKGVHANATADFDMMWEVFLRQEPDATGVTEIKVVDELGRTFSSQQVSPTTLAAPSSYWINVPSAAYDLGLKTALTVQKISGLTTVQVVGAHRWGTNLYTSNLDQNQEFSPGFKISGKGSFIDTTGSSRLNQNITFENVRVSQPGGDAIQVAADIQGLTINNSYSRMAGRQGFSVQHGRNITFTNNVSREAGRSAIDCEPTTTALYNIFIESNRFINPLNSAVAANTTGIFNMVITNNVMLAHDTPTLSFMAIQAQSGLVANNYQQGYYPGSTVTDLAPNSNSQISVGPLGQKIIITGNRTYGGISVGGTDCVIGMNQAITSLDGNNGVVFKDSGTRNLWYYNSQVPVTTGAFTSVGKTIYGAVNISSATNPTVIGMRTIHQTHLPDTFKGEAHFGDYWFVGGLALKGEPVTQVRGLSGSTVKSNQFVITVTPAANTTSVFVRFPAKPFAAFSSSTASSTTGAAAGSTGQTANWGGVAHTLFYRIAPHNYYGPASAMTTISFTLATSTSVAKIQIGGMVAAGSSRLINGFRIYRSTANATSTAYYDFIPTGTAKEFAAIGNNVTVYDFGSVLFKPGVTDEWGLSSATSIVTGAFTSMPAEDYTGQMLSTDYSVFPGTPDWNAGTVYVASSKTSVGFTLAWTGTTANGTNTIPLMFASS